VLEYEVPAFLADAAATQVNSTPPAPLYPPGSLSASSAVYSLWIGTNDLGIWAFLTNSQIPGRVLADYTACVFAVFDALYASGGRVFVLMNTVPLHLAPLYANDTLHGVGDNQYWPDKWPNHTAIAATMHEATTSVNEIFKYQTPFELLVADRYPGASFAVFDTYSLVSDIYDDPGKYLNGTGVEKGGESVWGFENHCAVNGSACVKAQGGENPDTFLWYDELHPRYVRVSPSSFLLVSSPTFSGSWAWTQTDRRWPDAACRARPNISILMRTLLDLRLGFFSWNICTDPSLGREIV